MRRIALTVVVATVAVALAACSSSTKTTGGSPTNSPTTVASGQQTSAPPPTTIPSASGAPVSLDPCVLVTSSEASALAHASFGAGKEEPISAASKQCVYGAQTTNVFEVTVAQAASPAEAQAQWTAAQAEAEADLKKQAPPGVSVNLDTSNASGIGDKAATAFGTASIQGQTIGFSGIYVVSGATFFAITDLTVGQTPPSTSAMKAQAQTVLSRI